MFSKLTAAIALLRVAYKQVYKTAVLISGGSLDQ